MKNFFISLIVLASCLQTKTYSQSKHACKASFQNEIIFKNNPKAKKEYDDFNKKTRLFSSKRNKSNQRVNTSYVIPVVFHVYGKTQEGKTISDQKIKIALQKLNDDFKGLNPDFNDVDQMFENIKSSIDIEFKLAKLDPNGNCSTGIIYYDEKSGYGDVYSDADIANDAWDNYKYMNVYIQNDLYADGSTTNSGVAWYPNSSMSDNNTARVVYNGAYLHGNTGDEFASVLTHEFGHWLNLIHTFQGGCTFPNDEVTDTPPEDSSVSASDCSPTQNCNGDYINYENYMGYNGAANGCYRMFTLGQVDRMTYALEHPARKPLWQSQNLIDTGVNNSDAILAIEKSTFKEAYSNDGTFNETTTISIDGGNFKAASGNLINGTDYNLNLPNGLVSNIEINTTNTVTLTISGTATNHTVNDNQNITLNFTNSAFDTNSVLSCNSVGAKLTFFDPYEIIYQNIDDVSASNPGNNWKWFYLPMINGLNTYGAWGFEANHLKIETYGKELVTENGSRNISLINKSELISSASNFTTPGNYPDQLDLRTPTYTNWDAKTGYIGFKTTHNNEVVHGWMKASVNKDGSLMTIYEYAFSTEPYGDIIAGQTLMDPEASELLFDSTTATENSDNSGNINFSTIISLSGAAKFSNKTFVKNVDYNSNIPNNYTVKVKYLSDDQAELVVIGTANNHSESDSSVYELTFLSPAFTNNYNKVVNKTNNFNFNFINPYTIIHNTLTDVSVDSSKGWQWFYIPELDNGFNEFGAWIFESNHLKIETYGKRLVTNNSTRNISLIGANELISKDNNFTSPGEYPDQLDLYTSTHQDWDNTTGYVGFESKYNGNTVYGWLKVTVSANGVGFTVTEYAFYTKPESAIQSGSITQPAVITWTGAINSEWNNVGNWSANNIPSNTSDVIIPQNATNFPTIESATTVNSVVIESGASLITNAELTATVTYKRNLATNNWYLIASPLKNETIENMLANNIFALGSNNNIGIAPYNNDGSSWNYLTATSTGNISSGKGYSVKLNTSGDIKFTGKTNSNTVTLPITKNTNSYNLVGNPYTSYINLGEFFNANPLNSVVSEATIWLWNQATDSYDIKLAGINSDFQIAPGQGYFISSNNNGNLTFDKANQSHTVGTFQRQENTRMEVNLTATIDGNISKSTKLYYIKGTTNGFDNGFDGTVFKGTENNFNIFTHLVERNNTNDFAVQSLPNNNLEPTIVPIGVKANAGQQITFSAKALNLPTDVKVYIEDKNNNNVTNLSEEDYTVTITENSNNSGQFYLHTSSKNLIIDNQPDVLEGINIFNTNNKLTITGIQSNNNSITIYSSLGQKIMSQKFSSNTTIDVPKVSTGVYIIELTSDLRKITKKVIFNN